MNIKPNINMKDHSIKKPYFDRFLKVGAVSFDTDNLYPDRILEKVEESPTQSAILENLTNYIYGLGLKDWEADIQQPNFNDSWDELLKKCITDYVYFNAFAIEVIPNELGDRFSYYHIPVMQVRCGQYNERNQIEEYYLSSDWTVNSWMSRKVKKIKAWGIEQPQRGEAYLMYVREYKPNQYYYALPSYVPALNWIMADGAIARFTNNFISNNMSCGKVLKFPNDIEDDRKQELYDALAECFGGAEQAGNTLVLFGEDGVLPEIDTLETKDADLYIDVNDMVIHALCTANQITSPSLLAIHDSNGFSSQSEEIITAYVLYLNTVVIPKRTFILTKLNDLLSLNGYPRVFLINDLNLQKELEGVEGTNDKKEEEAVQADNDNKTLTEAENNE